MFQNYVYENFVQKFIYGIHIDDGIFEEYHLFPYVVHGPMMYVQIDLNEKFDVFWSSLEYLRDIWQDGSREDEFMTNGFKDRDT